MNERESRKRKAGMAWAALSAGVLLGLASATVAPVRAQEAAGVTNSESGQVVSADLDYREVNYSYINWALGVTTRPSAFPKEPPVSQSKVARGVLQLGGGSNDLAFVWDRAGGKLYLDLNRNLDLTDDPAGVFSSRGGARDYYQTFANIHLPLGTSGGKHQALVDLNFSSYGALNCSAAMRSLWQGKLTLQGEEWQVGLLENGFQPRPSLGSGNLLLRPWAERNKSFSAYSGSLEAFPFSRKLFFGNRAYQLQCTNEAQGDKVRVQLTEQRPSLGELKITGDYVQRVTLEGGPYMVVIDKPEAVVRVPVGSYGPSKVCLRKGDAEAHLDGRAQSSPGRITINDRRPAVLMAGGPLTNSVSVNRQGRNLSLNYQLVGVGGAYQLVNQDRLHPPEFTVYQGDKKIASGKFEFG